MIHDDCCGNVVCDNRIVSGTKGEEVMHLSLKKRIILFFLLAMMLMVGFFALYFYQSTRDLMAQSERSLETIVSKSIEKEIADNLDFTEANVKAVVEKQKVPALFDSLQPPLHLLP